MTPLERINSMKMPFAELKGVTFIEAEKDRVVARMLVRPDLCTLGHTIHGGAIMAFADSVGAAATVVNLPDDAKGTTTIESKTNFIGGAREGTTLIATATLAVSAIVSITVLIVHGAAGPGSVTADDLPARRFLQNARPGPWLRGYSMDVQAQHGAGALSVTSGSQASCSRPAARMPFTVR